MKRIVFYSWQSDLPSAGNRNLIEDALKRALRTIARDETAAVEPVMDRDTADQAGTPDIAASILAKIAMSDVFVADVSIVNSAADGRLTPNPNVLLELGYAIAELGWDNVLLVQNGSFGGPELLPFDLRGRRTVVYEAADGFERAAVRGLLQGRLEGALRSALQPTATGSLPTGRTANLWWGPWEFGEGTTYGGHFFIREVGAQGFLFDLSVHHGAHMGSLTNVARIVSDDLAYCRVPNGDNGEVGEIMFRRSLRDGRRTIEVEETAPCSYYRGMRAHFGGRFERGREPWFDAGFMNELDMARLYALTGPHLEKMRSRTGDIGQSNNLDENLPATVVWGGIAGLYTVMQSIVMLDGRGRLWCAYIDDDKVRYFTNVSEWKKTLPTTVEQWRSNFMEKEVVFEGVVDTVPVWQQ